MSQATILCKACTVTVCSTAHACECTVLSRDKPLVTAEETSLRASLRTLPGALTAGEAKVSAACRALPRQPGRSFNLRSNELMKGGAGVTRPGRFRMLHNRSKRTRRQSWQHFRFLARIPPRPARERDVRTSLMRLRPRDCERFAPAP